MVTNNSTSPDEALAAVPVPMKRSLGRPRAQIDPADVEVLARRGLTIEQIGDRLGVSRRTMYARMASDATIREAANQGLAQGVDLAASKLMEQVEAGVLTAIIFYLRCRGKWSSQGNSVNINGTAAGFWGVHATRVF